MVGALLSLSGCNHDPKSDSVDPDTPEADLTEPAAPEGPWEVDSPPFTVESCDDVVEGIAVTLVVDGAWQWRGPDEQGRNATLLHQGPNGNWTLVSYGQTWTDETPCIGYSHPGAGRQRFHAVTGVHGQCGWSASETIDYTGGRANVFVPLRQWCE